MKASATSASDSAAHVSRILRFWRDLEFFLPFQLNEVFDRHPDAIIVERGDDKSLPWVTPGAYELDPEKEYLFDLFLAPFALEEVIEILGRIVSGIDRDDLPDPRRFEGLSCFLRIGINAAGTPLLDDLSVSTLPWALARFEQSRQLTLTDFDIFAGDVVRDFGRSNDIEERPGPLSSAELERIADSLSSGHPMNFFPNSVLAVIVPYALRRRKVSKVPVAPASDSETSSDCSPDPSSTDVSFEAADDSAQELRRKRKVDILNSFFLRDLERINKALASSTELSAPLRQYFARAPSDAERVDTLKDQAREEMLQYFPDQSIQHGRWPSTVDQFLGFQQQLALNRYFQGEQALYAVNGPPGTGKTTLVRDLLADLVVRRAQAIAALSKPADALESIFFSTSIGRRNFSYRRLKAELTGFELIVASSNNAAVENISLELPDLRSLGEEFSNLTYLKPVADLFQSIRLEEGLSAKEGQLSRFWGLPTVPLGNAKNRRRFCRVVFQYLWEEPKEDQEARLATGRRTISEWRQCAEDGSLSFQEAQRQFRAKLEAFQSWDRADPQRISRAARALSAHSVHSIEWQRAAPGSDERGNQLRSELFCAALKLQEAWLRHIPKFDSELRAIAQLIRMPHAVEPEAARDLWRLFFMVVPCFSTTLASVERMCATLPAQSIGHVVIEEAGQAMPQAAAGILWRAKRALVIGDQRQLEPVVITAPALEARLAHGLDRETRFTFSPLTSSVQSLADRSELFGTWFSDAREPVWVGLPLIIHRRCASPMFEIANRIAYDNLMLQGTAHYDSAIHSVFGPSCWYEVKGESTTRQWVPEQGQLAAELLDALLHSLPSGNGEGVPDIFFITPFREVKTRLKDLLRRICVKHGLRKDQTRAMLQRIGTVHAFQGKEADTVLFILGCGFSTGGAADWAGERPNLVNVAVTRARKHLYVIGDVNVWHNRGYFSDLEKALPKKSTQVP